ncbi:hypothetical protein ACHAXA_009500 [Cyclostephanos tholiformis]|uniref:Uncharacterized protein n=1 Tax=Cyclostephanos tholiformis TaxID=382380 RepID=A0ABD3RIY0_9STRA
MKYKLDSQMEVMDMLVDNRGISPTSSFDEDAGLRMRGPLPRPPPQPFVASPPPIPPPPPPSTRGGYSDANFVDDGRAYYQERNYGRGEGTSSSQRRMGKSANERSEGHYYDQMNMSFISSFSKMDNERRREFRPFADERMH